jgi:hypothetical protein
MVVLVIPGALAVFPDVDAALPDVVAPLADVVAPLADVVALPVDVVAVVPDDPFDEEPHAPATTKAPTTAITAMDRMTVTRTSNPPKALDTLCTLFTWTFRVRTLVTIANAVQGSVRQDRDKLRSRQATLVTFQQ